MPHLVTFLKVSRLDLVGSWMGVRVGISGSFGEWCVSNRCSQDSLVQIGSLTSVNLLQGICATELTTAEYEVNE